MILRLNLPIWPKTRSATVSLESGCVVFQHAVVGGVSDVQIARCIQCHLARGAQKLRADPAEVAAGGGETVALPKHPARPRLR